MKVMKRNTHLRNKIARELWDWADYFGEELGRPNDVSDAFRSAAETMDKAMVPAERWAKLMNEPTVVN